MLGSRGIRGAWSCGIFGTQKPHLQASPSPVARSTSKSQEIVSSSTRRPQFWRWRSATKRVWWSPEDAGWNDTRRVLCPSFGEMELPSPWRICGRSHRTSGGWSFFPAEKRACFVSGGTNRTEPNGAGTSSSTTTRKAVREAESLLAGLDGDGGPLNPGIRPCPDPR
jgi:hypothetical protein